jgi:branched-chain amino acid transport system permease protein
MLLVQQALNGLILGSVYALFAVGFTLIFSVLRILNLAHGAIFTWGAFFGLFAITRFGLPLPVAALAALVGAGLLSLLLDLVAFRPLRRRNAPEFSGLISSIGAAMVLSSIAQQVSQTRVLRYPFGTFPMQVFRFLGLRITTLQLVILATTVVCVVLLWLYLHATSFGRQVRAVANSEATAELLGVNPNTIYVQTFFIAGALAGIAGLLIGNAYNSVQYAMGDPYLLTAFVVVVIGGLGSITGAVAAGLLLGVVRSVAVSYLSADLGDATAYALTFVFLLAKPAGLFGNVTIGRRVERA